jgi:hypothetical protein
MQNKIGDKANILDISFYKREDVVGDLIKLYFDGQASDEITKEELDYVARLLKDMGKRNEKMIITPEDIGRVVGGIKEKPETSNGDVLFSMREED